MKDRKQFLVLFEVMKENYAADYDSNIPIIKMNDLGQPSRFAVIDLIDIKNQVGRFQSSKDSLEHKVVVSYFQPKFKYTAGQLKYI